MNKLLAPFYFMWLQMITNRIQYSKHLGIDSGFCYGRTKKNRFLDSQACCFILTSNTTLFLKFFKAFLLVLESSSKRYQILFPIQQFLSVFHNRLKFHVFRWFFEVKFHCIFLNFKQFLFFMCIYVKKKARTTEERHFTLLQIWTWG